TMSDALLPYYDRELNAIKRLAGDFAEAHPKIAGRLRVSADSVDDPHVQRLLEGVAFLAARVQHRLDDEFPELTDALLDLLYPHYLAPVPSCLIAQLACQSELQTPTHLPSGLAFDTEPVRGETLRYRSTAPVTLWPITVDSVRLSGQPLVAPPNATASGAAAVLRITLSCMVPEVTFSQLGVDRLRFFLRGPINQTLPLYELLGPHVLSVAYADTAVDPNPVIVPRTAVQPGGFGADEALLPWSARGFAGFRLMTEYFAFPEKFLFIEFGQIDRKTLASGGNKLEIFVYLDRSVPELERMIGAQSLALGCTPLVNLSPQRCEPVPLTHTNTEYRIVPDARRPRALEVWGVEQVNETLADGTQRPWHPFHRLAATAPDSGESGGFYQATRREAASGVPGTEVFLAPYDPDFDPDRPGDTVLSVDALCLNRDLPTDMPFGGGHPYLRLVEGIAAVSAITPMTAATTTLRPPLRDKRFWRLISHLSLGHLSITGGADGAAVLKEVLRLYDYRDTADTRVAINALTAVFSEAGVARAPEPPRTGQRSARRTPPAFCRGLDILLEMDPRAWNVSGLYLLASVLERFFALNATINSFTRTKVKLRGGSETVASWPARSGTRELG
ncbi:MAG TPA: type VI secretion system baseplate subunit TssF, partial [Rhodopila sp.]